ncbi:hypothetical protein DB346_12310 [Verrucomicrobia bacterium LW23]|nr:hypothetical protein DB346_12310 [Verrucomicrobia bacterium LW23]
MPAGGGNRPGIGGGGDRPGLGGGGSRPGGGDNNWRPSRPDGKPGRPGAGDSFVNRDNLKGQNFQNHFNNRTGGERNWENNRSNYWNNWSSQNRQRIDNFQANRSDRWGNLQNRREDWQSNRNNRREDWQSYRNNRREDWQSYRNDTRNFWADRGDEIRDCYRDSYCGWFTPNWWTGAAIWGTTAAVVSTALNPWWWWQPVTYTEYSTLYDGPPPPPVTYDYGTDVVIIKEEVYVGDEKPRPAPVYREEAIALANPATQPPPPIPASDKDPNLIPLGVWALVQQEKGDAVMFFQLSITRDGLVTGAFSNVLTGESMPIVGSVDKKTQRVAWHTGKSTKNAIECNLNGLTQNQTAVFLHFGTGQTQTWLLVRMPNPDMPDKPTELPANPAPAPAPAPAK